MPSRSSSAPDEIEMATVFRALKRRIVWLALLSTVVGGATVTILAMMAPRYQSEAELAIVAKGASSSFADPRSAAAGPDLVTTRMDKEAINTHVKAMQSPDLLEDIANELKLKDRPEFNSTLGAVDMIDQILRLVGIGAPRAGESERDRVLNALRSRLEIYSAKESRFIGVRMTSIDPDLAATIANLVAEKYRGSLAEQRVDEVDDQQSVLQTKMDKLAPEVAGAETEADRYRGKIDGFRGGAQNTGLNDQQMSDLTAELTRAKAARGEADARASSAREMMKLGNADALADVQKSPLIQNLVQQRVRIERQISELSATLLPAHPRMRQLNADLAGLKLQLNSETSKIVESLKKEAKVARGREDSIKSSLDDIKTRVVTNAPEEAQLRQLEATAKAKRTELESLQGQLESNRKKLDARAQPVEAQIISKAQAASLPVFPKKVQTSALIAVATMMFGISWTVAKAGFLGARRQAYQSQGRRAQPHGQRHEVLLRDYDEPWDALEREIQLPGPTEVQATANAFTEITAIAKRLAAGQSGESGRRTLLTGESDITNVTGEAIGLVKLMAQAGAPVILIDWSPSGNGIAATANLDTARGINDLLNGEAQFDDIIQRLPGSSSHAIACGGAQSQSGDGIDPDQLNLVLDALDEAYDQIIVVGRHNEARALFETIEGRFDAGIVVAERKLALGAADQESTFLGFEVADIDIIRFERPSAEIPVQMRPSRPNRARQMSIPQTA